jgi:threonine dehydrogenase-like Zn-dependent dehydrogenase
VSAFAALARAGAGRCAAIWGAGAKGVMFAHHLTRLGVPFACLIDVNPAKQGKYVAGSGLKVLSPEEAAKALSPGDRIFVMNSNYFDEIEGALGGRYQLTAIDRS